MLSDSNLLQQHIQESQSRLFTFLYIKVPIVTHSLISPSLGDMGFDEGEVLRDDMQDSLYKNAEASNLMIDGDLSKEKDNEKMDIDLNAPVKDDGFGDAGIDGGMFGKN